jgi:hypothetical protein
MDLKGGASMNGKDKRVDDYIAKAAPFARPILAHLRRMVHQACPEVRETIKWSFPHFEYNGILCSMAAFKNHCAFTFWKAALLSDAHNIFSQVKEKAMGHLGRITDISDLPGDEIMISYLREAMKLNEEGKKRPAGSVKGRVPV